MYSVGVIIFHFGCSGALAAVIEACKPGAKVVDLCETGDSFINSYVSFPRYAI